MTALLLLALACAPDDSAVDTDPGTDTDTDSDPDSDTDTDTDSDTLPPLPCEGALAILALGVPVEEVIEASDPVRWTGMGDYPTDVFAIELADTTPLVLHLEYPEPMLGTSNDYWAWGAFMDDTCTLRYGTRSVGGTQDTDTVDVYFTPDAAGWWFPVVFFPEAMPAPGAVPYALTVSPA